MTGTTLNFDGLYMPRKSFDLFNDSSELVSSTDLTTHRLIEVAMGRYNKEVDDYWRKMDGVWAREEAAFLGQDKPYHEFLPGRFFTYETIAQKIINELGDCTSDSETLDLGCGSGICLAIQAKKGVGRVRGFDRSYAALNFLEDLATHYNVRGNVETRQGDFYATGYDADRFDATFNLGVFEHLKPNDQGILMDEMVRVTKPGGIILVAIPNESSGLHKASRAREKGFMEYVLPMLKQHHAVDLTRLFEDRDIGILRRDSTLIAPPSAIPVRYFSKADLEAYSKLPKMTGANNPDELMKFWRVMEEKVISPEDRIRMGWHTYIIGKKS
jgi:SAM-dependent methyltransferase